MRGLMSSNATALTRLLLAERPSLLRLAKRIVGSEPAAEDVAQSLWFRVQKVEDDPPILNKRAYLFRLTANLARDHRKNEARRLALHAEAHSTLWDEDNEPSLEDALVSVDALRRVADAAERLPEPTRRIFRMNRFEAIPQRAIADRLGISSTTVENHIKRALAILAAARDGRVE